MLKIRLRRMGKKKQPEYRIVVAEKTSAVKGQYLEKIGYYNPRTKETKLDADKVKVWLDRGAEPSNTVAKLIEKAGVTLPKWVKIEKYPERPAKKEAKKEAGAPAAGAEQTTAPVAEGEVAEVAVADGISEETPVETPAEDAPVEASIEEVKEEVKE